ncbi:hypothetical protein NPIL_533691 [Nephila pilipes]|uniref:Uncharacterized protein n=1 Tax=Nephila pilipes TaxID=299642 RepID=A0A8X6QH32_NEPPI|nr:hypothetical protein NPIL_533691 [Nephila pilipes]
MAILARGRKDVLVILIEQYGHEDMTDLKILDLKKAITDIKKFTEELRLLYEWIGHGGFFTLPGLPLE